MKKLVLITIALLVLSFEGKTQTDTQNFIKTTSFQQPYSQAEIELGSVPDDHKLETLIYFDGLGRSIQEINARAGGNRENIVIYKEYDSLGLQTKEYLPWASNGQVPTSTSLNFIAPSTLSNDIFGFYNTAKYDNTTNPYDETVFEDSPLLRVKKQGAPGASWAVDHNSNNDHTIKIDYQLNSGDVYQFSVDFIGGDYSDPELKYDGNYTGAELSVTVIMDENWEATNAVYGRTYEFKDKFGKVILKRTSVEDPTNGPQDPNYHDTYFVYDDYGNLTFVIPPKASESILTGSNTINQTIINNLGYQYKYDRRNRLIWKKIPGKGYEVIVYDNQDRPILSQDALMRAENPNKYLFVKYDCLDRPAYTGFHISNFTLRQDVQDDVPNTSNCEVITSSSSLVGDTQLYYSNIAYPSTNLEILTVNYYDEYVDHTGLTRPTNVYGENPTLSNVMALATVNKVRVLGTNDWITSLLEYDEKGRSIYVATKNDFLNTTDIVYSQLDFTGKMIETTSTHLKSGNATITVVDYFIYDQNGRMISQKQKIDNEPVQLIIENTFDELGRLIQKDVGGETFLGGYTNITEADVTFDGIITRNTPGPPSWTSGAKTKGEIITDGGIKYAYNNILEDKAIRVGLEKTNSGLLGWDSFDYAIYHLITDADGDGSKDLKVMINNSLVAVSEEYDYGDVFSIERVGQQIQFKKNNASPFYTYNETSGTTMVGKASFFFGEGSIAGFEIFGSTIDSKLQSISYKYNVRGWLTDINNIDDGNLNPKLFNFRINYDQIEGNNNGTALYNGDIAQTLWKTNNKDPNVRGYNYGYDDLNRIIEAKGYKGSTVNLMTQDFSNDINGIAYDKNGNIMHLTRNGSNSTGTGYGVWDDLTYTYGSSSNQLLKVNDGSPDATYKPLGFNDGYTSLNDDFEYDVNGNLVKDRNKEIATITYNHLNLPTEIIFETLPNKVSYVYDATGLKMQKSITTEGTISTEYAGRYVYNNSEDGSMKLQFFSHSEGYVEPVANTSKSITGSLGGQTTYSNYGYVFQYKDHLGNVRLSYADGDLDGSINASSEIIEESNYYPFGLSHLGYNTIVSGNGNGLAQQYMFVEKELSNELNLNTFDFGARNYDPSLGRWMNIDALAEQAYDWTTYRYSFNNPVNMVDIDGLFEFSWQLDENGEKKALRLSKSTDPDAPPQDLATFMLETGLTEDEVNELFGGKEKADAFFDGKKTNIGVQGLKGRLGKQLKEMEKSIVSYNRKGNLEFSNCGGACISLGTYGRIKRRMHLSFDGVLTKEFDLGLNLAEDYTQISSLDNYRIGDIRMYWGTTNPNPQTGRNRWHSATILLVNHKETIVFYKRNGRADGEYMINTEQAMREADNYDGEIMGNFRSNKIKN